MNKKLCFLLAILILVLLVAACGGPSLWSIASEGEACTPATVIDRAWSDSDRDKFHLLLKVDDGEIGRAIVNEFVYDSHQIGEVTCVIR